MCTVSIGTNRLLTIVVRGTRSVFTTRILGLYGTLAKYSTASMISASDMAWASKIMTRVLAFLCSAERLSPLRIAWIWRTKYSTGRLLTGAFSCFPWPFGRWQKA